MLLALLLLAGGLVGAIVISVLVMSELRQASSLDNSIIAYYEAEGGLEKGLYDIRQNDCGGGCDNTSYRDCKHLGATCEIQIGKARQVVAKNIGEDQIFQVDLDPLDSFTGINVTWNRKDALVDPKLSVTFINNDPVNGLVAVRPANGIPIDCVPTGDACTHLLYKDPDDVNSPPDPVFLKNKTEQARFKALNDDIINLIVQPVGSSCLTNPCTFSYYLDVASKGKSGRTQYVVKTSVPKQLPTYGFPDYVIFSQQEIVK